MLCIRWRGVAGLWKGMSWAVSGPKGRRRGAPSSRPRAANVVTSGSACPCPQPACWAPRRGAPEDLGVDCVAPCPTRAARCRRQSPAGSPAAGAASCRSRCATPPPSSCRSSAFPSGRPCCGTLPPADNTRLFRGGWCSEPDLSESLLAALSQPRVHVTQALAPLAAELWTEVENFGRQLSVATSPKGHCYYTSVPETPNH